MESFYHFSHEHQLELTRSPHKENISCSGCNLKILSDKGFYSCKKACPFLLHQVCYNMPRRTQHPAHPTHYLTLHPKPSPSGKTLQCRACGGHVNGFHYTCAEYGLYYHTLCSALPLSISVSSHTHNLKLTFSAPYDFCCDICNKPCNKFGWLYRCQFCEYDTHLSCAIYNRIGHVSNLEHQIAPFPNSTTTSTTRPHSSYLSTTLKGITRSVDYTSDELMELVTQGHYLQLVGPSPPSSTTPVPEDLSTTQSYQFSEACFSIDLDRSYSNYGHHRTNLAKRQANSIDQVSKGTTAIMPNMIILSNSKQNKQQQSTSYAMQMGLAEDHRLKQSYLIRSPSTLPFMEDLDQNEKKRKATSDINKGKPTKSDQAMSKRPSWQNLLSCILPSYEKRLFC